MIAHEVHAAAPKSDDPAAPVRKFHMSLPGGGAARVAGRGVREDGRSGPLLSALGKARIVVRIRIVGAGAMGRGIAQWAAAAGHTVELGDVRTEAVTAAARLRTEDARPGRPEGRMTAEDAAAAAGRLVPLDDPWPRRAPEVELVIEAVREDLETKTALFGSLEQALPAQAVFATNTSSLSVTRIAAGLADPSRLAGLHFFNPVPLMKIVEVVPGAPTRAGDPRRRSPAWSRLAGTARSTVADTPGFLVNHAGRGLVTEALALLEESVAEPAGHRPDRP